MNQPTNTLQKYIKPTNALPEIEGEDYYGYNDEESLKLLQTFEASSTLEMKPIFRQSYKISVSELLKINWCEYQHKYSKILPKPEQKAVMKFGVKRHLELELKVHKFVPIKIVNKADAFGANLLDSILRIENLLKNGVCRELRVFGFIRDDKSFKQILVTGIIDLIEIKDNQIYISENKTRKSPTLPREIQSNSNQLQLMVYKTLLNNMIGFEKSKSKLNKELEERRQQEEEGNDVADDYEVNNIIFDYKEYLKYLTHSNDLTFSEEFLKELKLYNITNKIQTKSKISKELNLKSLLKYTLKAYSKLPRISNTLNIIYEQQRTQLQIGEINFNYNGSLLRNTIETGLDYYFGRREPIGILDIEEVNFKCGYCDFKMGCEWRAKMAVELANKK